MHNSHLLLLSLWYKVGGISEQRMPTKGSEGEETKRAETMHVNRWVFGRSAHKDSCGCCTGTGRHRLKEKESETSKDEMRPAVGGDDGLACLRLVLLFY